MLLPTQLLAQPNSNIKHYTTADGLPSTKIYQSIQDQKGFMWFATDQGVVKFDGYNFKIFNAKDGLPSDDVFKLSEDNSGRIWLSTFNELGYIQNDQYAKIDIPEEVNTKGVIVHFIEQNVNYSNHFVTTPQAFLQIDADTITYKEEEISSSYISNIGFDTQGQNWFSVKRKNIFYFSKDEISIAKDEISIKKDNLVYGDWSHVFFPKQYLTFLRLRDELYLFDFKRVQQIGLPNETKGKTILRIAKLSETELLIEFKNKYLLYNINTTKFSQFDYPFPIEATRIQRDKSDNLWAVTNNGVFYQSKEEGLIKAINLPFAKAERRITAIFRDRQKRLWIGTAIGEIFVEISPNTFKKIKLIIDGIENNRKVKSIGNHPSGGVIIGGDYGIFNLMLSDLKRSEIRRNRTYVSDFFHHSNSTNYASILVKDMSESSTALLLATSDGFMQYDSSGMVQKTKFIRTERAYSISHSADGTIYIGKKSGLYQLQNNEEVKQNFDLPLSTLFVDSANTLWLGTEGRGLYYKKDGAYHFVKSTDDETTKSIVEDPTGALWILTNKNLLKVTLSADKPTPTISFAKTTNGINIKNIDLLFIEGDALLLGTSEGLKKIQLSDVQWGKSQRELLITEILVNGQPRPFQSTYDLSYKENCIDINFVSLEYNSPNNVIYQYQMKGLDTTWQSTKSLKQEYWFLPSGEYTFSIQAGFNEQNLSPIRHVKFNIATPWWKEWWAWILIGLSLLSIASIIIYQRTKMAIQKAKARAKIEEQVSELKLQALQSQMNPHFIFNALASVQEYIFDNDQKLANKYLVMFSRLMRLILESSRKSTLLLSEELKLIDLYVNLEQLRFSDKFEYQKYIDPQLDSNTTYIPSMLIQPFIENAINHGLYHKKEGKGLLQLYIDKSDSGLIIKVIDNGVGLQKAKAIKNSITKKEASRALEIVRERTKLYNKKSKDDISLEISELYDTLQNVVGTQVVLLLDKTFSKS